MHLLNTIPGTIPKEEFYPLQQTPGEVVILSTADTELKLLAIANRRVQLFDLRLASLLQLSHSLSIDLYNTHVISQARLVVVRILGGYVYWPYGVEQVAAICRRQSIPVVFLPGDNRDDVELTRFSTVPSSVSKKMWNYLLHGGLENAEQFLRYVASFIGYESSWREPVPLPPSGIYPDVTIQISTQLPIVVILFYRALVQSGDTTVIDAIIQALKAENLSPLALFVTSLKDSLTTAFLHEVLAQHVPDVILNTTGFSISATESNISSSLLSFLMYLQCPVLQVVLASSEKPSWQLGNYGLTARDIAMNVALPEMDGRLFSRAIAFKRTEFRDKTTEYNIITHEPVFNRITITSKLASSWVRLHRTTMEARRIILILANYPNRDGRIGNGVGLDTPESTASIITVLAKEGYTVINHPPNGTTLLEQLLDGPTNTLKRTFKSGENDKASETLNLDDYQDFLDYQPESVQLSIWKRWGAPDQDPFITYYNRQRFIIPAIRFGNIAVAIQPARGYNIDPVTHYHDPDLVPPHNYLAFYVWVRQSFSAHAVVHVGKHGNVEWLPGKALALSEVCWPEVILGPIPHLYPFIVNDPGEGTQAKRRTGAVIIDHLTPPLTRAESYGLLRDLEQRMDEYYEAMGIDPKRVHLLQDEILSLAHTIGLDHDLDIQASEELDTSLVKLDNHLCALKELQIRDGLHIFGKSPDVEQQSDLLIALARIPRGSSTLAEASIIRALADDLQLGFDPLDASLYAELWVGPRPDVLRNIVQDSWRTTGDTIERLEKLARNLLSGQATVNYTWTRTPPILEWLVQTVTPRIASCGRAEMTGLLQGLQGCFVIPGPSGAPTRGHVDVLPTGRNFYSIDIRTVPTPAAWALGWKSAALLLERHLQKHGTWPRSVILTAWGTSNMRTGGDDIAQGLALLGVRPTWEETSRRLTGFEILPVSVIGRPRVDVTLRVSGFFRDAFPNLLDLFDQATRAVSALDESEDSNPLAARVQTEAHYLTMTGLDPMLALQKAGYRVFGSKPGTYGAGLQALIDEREWNNESDLACAYLTWGGYAYGSSSSQEGVEASELFADRLRSVDTVIQNQDNREHDLLDSDDYYQFEGGVTAAIRVLSGHQPVNYHIDHSHPETPKIHTLQEEIAYVVRGRAANPKWINGVMRHGYKGAFEIAATVDYLFAFAASANCVENHHFDLLFNAYLGDDTVRTFLQEANPHVLRDIAERFSEAYERGLWKPHRNIILETLSEIIQNYNNKIDQI